jgi:predicted nucleotide-binding protein (sugar kinase/HSP70/actin superfamily)
MASALYLRSSKVNFFIPSYGGPCRFEQYHKLQQFILEKLGFADAAIISPSDRNFYASFSCGRM